MKSSLLCLQIEINLKNLLWGCVPRERQFLQVPSYRQVAKSNHLSDKLMQFETCPLRLQSFDAMAEII